MSGIVNTISPRPNKQKFWRNFSHLLGTEPEKLSKIKIEVVNENYRLLQDVTPYLSKVLSKSVVLDAPIRRYGSEFRIRPEKEITRFRGEFQMADSEEVSLSTSLSRPATTSLFYILNIPFPEKSIYAIELQANGLSRALAGSALNYFQKALEIQLTKDATRIGLEQCLPHKGLKLIPYRRPEC